MKRFLMFMALALCLFLFVSGTMAVYSADRQWTGSITIADIQPEETKKPEEQSGSLQFSSEVFGVTLSGAEAYTAVGRLEVDDAKQHFTLYVDIVLTQATESLSHIAADSSMSNHYGLSVRRTGATIAKEGVSNAIYLGEVPETAPNGTASVQCLINPTFVLPSFDASWEQSFRFDDTLNTIDGLPDTDWLACGTYTTAAIVNIRYEKPEVVQPEELKQLAVAIADRGKVSADWKKHYHGELAENSTRVNEQEKRIDVNLVWVLDELKEQGNPNMCFNSFTYALPLRNPNAFPVQVKKSGDRNSTALAAGSTDAMLDLAIDKQSILAPAYSAQGAVSNYTFERDLELSYQLEGTQAPYTQQYHIVVTLTLEYPGMAVLAHAETLAPSPSPSLSPDPSASVTPDSTVTPEPAHTAPDSTATPDPAHTATPDSTATPEPTPTPTVAPADPLPDDSYEDDPDVEVEVLVEILSARPQTRA